LSKLLLREGCVLTLGARTANHARADVLIEDGKIAEIGAGVRARDAEIIDATDTIVMPGFVDCHRQMAHTLFRGTGHLGDPPAAGHFEDDDIHAATLLGLLSAAEAGATTVVDWCEAADEARLDAVLRAHAEAAIRSVVVVARPPGTDVGVWKRLLASDTPENVTLAAGSEEPGSVPDHEVQEQWAMARDAGLRIHARAGLSEAGRGAIRRLADAGAMGRDVTLVHCTRLSDADFDAIASSGASVVLAPSDEMATGAGMPPVQDLMDRQIKPGLGVGKETLAPGDIFAQMRGVISIQHARYFDLKLAGKAGLPNLLNTRETIKFGTSYGAAAVGLGDVTGSLEVGKQADLVVLRTDRPNIWPINDPIGAVVWGMDTSNLDWVIVAGRPVVRDGRLVGDTSEVRRLAEEARQRVATRAGLLEVAGGPA
jgi:cytosine/adenosine deaminase-related metal-dependent hydrolase